MNPLQEAYWASEMKLFTVDLARIEAELQEAYRTMNTLRKERTAVHEAMAKKQMSLIRLFNELDKCRSEREAQ